MDGYYRTPQFPRQTAKPFRARSESLAFPFEEEEEEEEDPAERMADCSLWPKPRTKPRRDRDWGNV